MRIFAFLHKWLWCSWRHRYATFTDDSGWRWKAVRVSTFPINTLRSGEEFSQFVHCYPTVWDEAEAKRMGIPYRPNYWHCEVCHPCSEGLGEALTLCEIKGK